MSKDAPPEEVKADGRGKSPGTQSALREHAMKPGETRNKKGVNGWKKAQSRIVAFMKGFAADGKTTRWERVLQSTYTSALMPGPRGAPDRKLLVEQCAGRAKQQIDIKGDGAVLRVLALIPDNGRGPGDPDPGDEDDIAQGEE